MGKTVVISAVNLRKGGTLTILNNCLRELSLLTRSEGWRVVALVHRKELALYDGIEYIEIPWSVRSWAHRLWCEYVTMHGISKRIGNIDLWLSLHDTTPRVCARHQTVYCHNAYPFFHWHWRHLWQNYRIVCFALFTRWFYRINLHRNDFVIVQQQWFREAFQRMFFNDNENDNENIKVVVFPPNDNHNHNLNEDEDEDENEIVSVSVKVRVHEKVRFLYPAYPDVHKNLECLCEAAQMLEQEVGRGHFEVLLTTSPDDNRYSRWLHRKWGDVTSIRFCGFMPKEELSVLYAQMDCLVFPSLVETWGLPISEFAATGQPMLLADLPYAHEAAAGSRHTAFFNPHKPEQLKQLMLQLLRGDHRSLQPITKQEPPQPVVHNWREVASIEL